MHEIGPVYYETGDGRTSFARVRVELYECDTCGAAVSDPDLHKTYTGYDGGGLPGGR